MSNTPQLNIATGSIVPVYTTIPDHILRHEISDEELDMLSQGEKDRASNIMYTSAGAILGAAPTTIAFIIQHTFNGSKTPINTSDLIQMIIFFGGIAVCVCFKVMIDDKSVSVKSLVTKIRNRTNARRN